MWKWTLWLKFSQSIKFIMNKIRYNLMFYVSQNNKNLYFALIMSFFSMCIYVYLFLRWFFEWYSSPEFEDINLNYHKISCVTFFHYLSPKFDKYKTTCTIEHTCLCDLIIYNAKHSYNCTVFIALQKNQNVLFKWFKSLWGLSLKAMP
jgi:hypothetical protein